MAATQRIAPRAQPYSTEIDETLARLMPPGRAPLNLFRTLAKNERVLARVLAGGLLDKGTLCLRDREIVIDRTCARCGCEYEWGVHVAFFAERAGLTAQEIEDTCAGSPASTAFPPRDRLLLRLVDELHDASTVSDDLWAELKEHWEPDQLIELLVLCGFYHLISFAARGLNLELEADAARFPA